MITEDLIAYIQTQIRKNISNDIIASRLRNAGWHELDIEEALRKVTPPAPKEEQPSSTRPAYIEPSTPTFEKETYKIADQYRELPEASIPKETPVIDQTIETLSTSPKEISAPVSKPIVRRPEPVMYIIPGTDLSSIKTVKSTIETATYIEPTPKIEEPIPTLIPKTPTSPVATAIKPLASSPTINNLPRNALISSYAEDLSLASINQGKNVINKMRLPMKITIMIVFLSIVGGVVFALAPNFIKKDTKTLLLTAPITFGALDSYKSQTKASISLPSFANIAAGLVGGDAVSSTDRDSISIYTEGLINQHNGMATSSKYKMTFGSSVWSEDIVTDVFYDGIKSYMNIPSLIQILGKNAPVAQTVSIQKGKFKVLSQLFPSYLQSQVSMIDIDKMLSKGVDPYTNTNTGIAYKEFITTADIIEKSPESISGTPTYHYQINADKQATKKLLSSLADFFLINSSKDTAKFLEESLGTITLDTFEVWIGKKDNNIHQYRFVLSIPLSKVIGLDDKGIAGNKVTLDWMSTFSNFNIQNDITMPQDAVPIEDFIKKIDDMKIIDTVSPLKSIASDLFDSTGSFGNKSNPSGSCTEPTPGSLFSPINHSKIVATTIGNISSTMNTIIDLTDGVGSCYSTPKAWAVAFPLASEPNLFFCVDSMNTINITSTPLVDTACK